MQDFGAANEARAAMLAEELASFSERLVYFLAAGVGWVGSVEVERFATVSAEFVSFLLFEMVIGAWRGIWFFHAAHEHRHLLKRNYVSEGRFQTLYCKS